MKPEAERHRDRLAGQLHSLGHEVSLVFAPRASTAQVNPTEQNSDPLIHLYARGSPIGVGELTDKGELHLVDLPPVRIHRKQVASGLFCW